jgi:hypothetical protein
MEESHEDSPTALRAVRTNDEIRNTSATNRSTRLCF